MNIGRGAFELISIVIQRVGHIELPANGDSMFPFIEQGDLCTFIRHEPSQLKIGDIVLYKSSHGQLVAHRLHQVTCEEGFTQCLCKGDANAGYDEPIGQEQIIGKLTSIRKGQNTRSDSDMLAVIWKKTMISFPHLSSLIRRCLNIRG